MAYNVFKIFFLRYACNDFGFDKSKHFKPLNQGYSTGGSQAG